MPSLTLTPDLPTHQTALLVASAGTYALSHTQPLPPLDPTTVLVRTRAVALNPSDAKMVDFSPATGCVGGYDFAGHVVALGSEACTLAPHLQIGDRVCGVVFGANPGGAQVGAFAEYVAAEAGFVLRLPDDLAWEDAAGMGVAVATVGLALYHSMGLRMPEAGKGPNSEEQTRNGEVEWAFVYGGSTACGTMAIQMLKLSGYKVVTACSPRSFPLCTAYGASVCFDYHSATCAADIRMHTRSRLAIALDCITDAQTMALCYSAVGDCGGKYEALDPFPMRIHTRSDIKPHWVFVLSMFGQAINMKGAFKRKLRPQDGEFERRWFQRVQALWEENKIRSHPPRVMEGGLEKVAEGIDEVRKGNISGEKLIYLVGGGR
ncbi:hypothetical protein MMC30_002469 [Trapelia coarctata]|nr:hypothetical protein [Trapelia coarctata]